ncbi:MFS transporter [Corynebacterium riegelii]|uniref:MFS transporter n=1 Tax=Corynebacterium riegelii TaxID=156976 RepID=UPI002889D3E1|nr:MFS transporter [Corynebacterium riegelii]
MTTPSPFSDASEKRQRWMFFAIISLGLFMISLDNSIMYTALPSITEQLGASQSQALWIINAYPLVLSGLLLGTGTLGDRVGHRLMFMVGLIVFGAASLMAAFSPTPEMLIAARAFLGIGGATMMPATLALISLTFPYGQERNTAIGLWGAVAVVGNAMGPVIGGLLLAKFWWGSLFLINVPVVIIALVATALLAPPNVANKAKKWDATSSIYSLIALLGMTVAIKQAANPERTTVVMAVAVVAMLLFGLLFHYRQKRLTDPLLTLDIFRSPIFLGGVIAAGGSMFVFIGAELHTVQKLQLINGYSPLHAGLVIIAMALGALPASILGGANLHRIGFLPLVSGGFVGGGVGTLLLIAGEKSGSLPLEILALVLLGFSLGLVMSVASTAIIGSAPAHRSGMAAGVEEVAYEFGALVTVAITGALMARWLALGEATLGYEAAYVDAYQDVLWLVAGISMLFAVITWVCFYKNPKTASDLDSGA